MKDKTRNSGQWTEARYNTFIKGILRKGSTRWPPKYEVIKDAFSGRKINAKTGRLANHYRCSNCGNDFPLSNVEVDHISPIVDPIIGFTTWDDVIERMFCEKDNLAVLCHECHQVKTQREKQLRKEHNNNE